MTEETYDSGARHTITVHLVCRDAASAAEWYVRALGAEERGRVPFRTDDSCRSSFVSATRP
jgi:uncharacterized glyoxalase superfamily protein PhnB